jgi:glutamate--cysteine ligase
MARDQVDMTPIETREELIAWFEAGSKPKSQFRIGTEHEKFVFTVEGHNPVPYDGSRSIRALLEGMQHRECSRAWAGPFKLVRGSSGESRLNREVQHEF